MLVKGATNGRSSTVEVPYSDIFSVARRELGLFQLTAVQATVAAPPSTPLPPGEAAAAATGAVVAQTKTFDFWGAAGAVSEACHHLSDVVEDRRYGAVAGQEIGAHKKKPPFFVCRRPIVPSGPPLLTPLVACVDGCVMRSG